MLQDVFQQRQVIRSIRQPLAPAAPTATLTQPTCTTPTGTITITSPAPAAGITYSIDGINYTNTDRHLYRPCSRILIVYSEECFRMCFSSDKLYDQCGCINSCSTNCNVDATYMYNTNRNDHHYFTSTCSRITYSIDGINYTNTTGIFTGLAPNAYSVTVKNAAGCVSAATSYTINAVCINSCSTNCNVDATYLYNTNRNDHHYFTSTGSRDHLFN
jgi:hypothetical protein